MEKAAQALVREFPYRDSFPIRIRSGVTELEALRLVFEGRWQDQRQRDSTEDRVY